MPAFVWDFFLGTMRNYADNFWHKVNSILILVLFLVFYPLHISS